MSADRATADRATGADMRAFVAFADDGKRPWARLLKPGFRHCFVLLHDPLGWITVDPLSSRIDVARPPVAPAADLPACLRREGFRVVPANLCKPGRADWPQPFTCVAVVKRLLGLRAPFVFTPWQLYRHLLRQPVGEPRS